jgi:ribosomal protein S4
MNKSFSPAKAYRKFNEDLWGSIILRNKINKLGVSLIETKSRNSNRLSSFSFDITSKKSLKRNKRLSKYGFFFLERQKISAFYGGYSKKQYKKLCKAVSSKNKSNFNSNLSFRLESSLAFCLYRNGFFSNVNNAAHFVRLGRVLVNKEVIVSPLHAVKPGEVVEIRPDFKEKVFVSVLSRLKKKEILSIGTSYSQVNFALMSITLLDNKFVAENVFYPFKFSYTFFNAEFKGKF